MKHLEFRLQKQVSRYLKLKYPEVKFIADYSSHLKLTEQQKSRNKDIQCDDFKMTDLLIIRRNKEYTSLCLELKKETPFKKNGELK